MSVRSVRLIIKQFRFELVAIVAVLLMAAALGLVVVARLPGLIAQSLVCTDGLQCQGILEDAGRMQSLGGLVPVVATIVGVFGGIVLGVAVVGREVERGTAALAWPLARSRRRWLIARVVVIGAILSVVALIPALVADRLVAVLYPGHDAATSFVGFEARGLLPIGRDLAAFGVGILAGAAFGRVLPGLLFGLMLAAAGGMAMSWAVGAWRSADAVVISMANPEQGGDYETNLVLDSAFRDGAGNILSMNDVYSHVPDGPLPDGWPDSVYESVIVGIPGARHPTVDAREAAMWVFIGLLLVGGSAYVVERRRPY